MTSRLFKSIRKGLLEAIAYSEGRLTEGVRVTQVDVTSKKVVKSAGKAKRRRKGTGNTRRSSRA